MTAEEVLVKHEVFKTPDKFEKFNLIFHRDTYLKAQSNIYNAMIEFAQYHVKKALYTASMSADIEDFGTMQEGTTCVVDRLSILECYPKENIK